MEYITVREAAQKWGISVRLVQRHCAEGRVEGARKFGGTWAIPAKASKPEDPRRKGGKAAQACPPPSGRQACGTSALLMPLLNTAFVPGSCLRSIEAMQEGPQRELALAEYHYFRGEAQQAVQMLQPYLTSPDLSARLSACLIYAYANLSVGQIAHARYALAQVRALLEGMGPDTPAPLRAAGAFAALAGAVLLHLPCPKSCRTPGNISPCCRRAFAPLQSMCRRITPICRGTTAKASAWPRPRWPCRGEGIPSRPSTCIWRR